MKDLTQEQWVAQIKEDENAVIIDVRRPEEWANGIQENAILMDIMDFDSFQEKVNLLESSKSYYVYCRSGVRSVKACEVLEAFGHHNTYNLLGGILPWQGKIVKP